MPTEVRRPRGRPRGWRCADPRRVMVNVRLTAAEAAALGRRADKERTSRSRLMRELLLRGLDVTPAPRPPSGTAVAHEVRALRRRLAWLEVAFRSHRAAVIVTPADTKASLSKPLHISIVEATRLRRL